MTQKKKLPEQIASHTYKRQLPKEGSRASAKVEHIERKGLPEQRAFVGKEETPEVKREILANQGPRQRIVTVPKTDPSTAWNAFSQRQERRRRATARKGTAATSHVRLEARTYARTGSWATIGRTRGTRRPLPSSHRSSSVPTRSGRRGPRRGWLWRILGSVVGLIGLGLAINFVFSSNAFRIEQVNVTGTKNDALIHTIQKMGIQGDNIFLANIPSMKERVETLPLVASASVSKQWPNQLTVVVTERKPVLLWQTPAGTYSVDSQGVVIAPASQTQGADHLRVVEAGVNTTDKNKGQKGSTIQPLHAGTHLNAADVSFALHVFERLPQVTGINTFKLRYDGTIYPGTTSGSETRGTFVVESPDGWIAYLGSAADANPLENRLIAMQQILLVGKKQEQHLATIDVRYGLHPVYTIKS
ncbi:hypothetical protein KSF_029040 [Reticulibacter mediterranei]|uniref:POTRA domain-containing protein n=1 Tax=Reticulibacter mediterranei TaxID=2778369 RepID=A0A8J3IP27_9CHLR|nr:FtsQ-type POTRA domain-containing protein [Reticulibacter mediterranei]GHO92856.1 hypothetical protein KSF_029040 [Reticulibacter mediterranei]